MQRDYVGYILAIISMVVGIGVSWYYYDKSQQYREPAFKLDFFPSTIYDSKKDSTLPLKVLAADGSLLTESVHVARHVFWNNGTMPILASDVLTPVRVSFVDDASSVLSVSVVQQARAVNDCSINSVSKNSFILAFRILESKEGCMIKVIYTGEQYPPYKVESDMVGVKEVKYHSETVKELMQRVTEQQFDWRDYWRWVARVVGVFAFAFAVWKWQVHIPVSRRKALLRTFMYSVLLLEVLYFMDLVPVNDWGGAETVSLKDWVVVDSKDG
ncbi:UNVERIFIED_ORG: hypothetical protein J2W16_004040 [Pseudomonas cremoricolorata]|nr:hypothetical protein [Pseudomonas cremoricolorata]